LFTQGMVIHETYRSQDGRWLLPTEVRIEGEGDGRAASEIATGKPAVIGSIEKMSKSKKNLVDPDDIISTYGADCVRWFILSDSPPERDVIFSEAGVAGASRYMQRIWRLMDEIEAKGAARGAAMPSSFGADALKLRKATHKAIAHVGDNIDGLRFNVAVAHLYEYANAIQTAAGQTSDGMDWALREAGEALVRLISPFMPHIAEECWARLGYNTLVAEEAWPVADAALVVDDTITIAVQVNGKRRDELTIDKSASPVEVEAAALQLEQVQRALDGKTPKKVIVVPQRIVNVVV
ncbi:MAG: class I tRNA ligase family protein, partial [Hyphomicrobiaceae bacterium]|nr:class I tRNA ligase family protein [Hyphomicrobiaceae bacterium]